jgi:hypothetical protein
MIKVEHFKSYCQDNRWMPMVANLDFMAVGKGLF